MSIPDDQVKAAIKHLRKTDPVMRETIRRVGPFTLKLQRNRFQVLVRSIISQQISTKAARAIRERLENRVSPGRGSLTAEKLMQQSSNDLRSVGLSAQKASYILDLSEKVLEGEVRLRRVGNMTDEEVIEELIKVKGIGSWTAQMFLMFCLGRLDVFPYDDFGIRSNIQKLYGLKELPNKTTSCKIAEPWRPYASVASWYCWRSGDLE